MMELVQLAEEQLNERYKHFVLYGPPRRGKSQVAKYLVHELNGRYFDLLLKFGNTSEFKETIDVFGPNRLGELISDEAGHFHGLFVVDHMDFLVHTWAEHQMRDFVTMIEMNETSYSCLFVVQDYKWLSQLSLANDKGHSRIINVFDIQQGGIIGV